LANPVAVDALRRRHVFRPIQVEPGRECAAGAAQDDDADVLTLVEFDERSPQFVHHLLAHRVELVGPVQRKRSGATFDGYLDGFVQILSSMKLERRVANGRAGLNRPSGAPGQSLRSPKAGHWGRYRCSASGCWV